MIKKQGDDNYSLTNERDATFYWYWSRSVIVISLWLFGAALTAIICTYLAH